MNQTDAMNVDGEQRGVSLDRRQLLTGASSVTLLATAVGAQAGAAVSPMLPRAGSSWPQRKLLKPDVAASWDFQIVEKAVAERRPLPRLSESGSWKATAPARIQSAAGGGLELSAPVLDPQLVAHAKGPNGFFFGTTSYVKDGRGAVYWRHVFDVPQDWSAFTQLAMEIRPQDTGLPSYRLALALASNDEGRESSDPLPFHFLPGLRAGEWNKVVWDFTELDRTKVTQLAILLPLVGPLGKETRYSVRGFELQNAQPEHVSGWALAPGRIACNQHGYDAAGRKVAIATAGGEQFELVDTKSNKPVQRLPATIVRTRLGAYATLDFSAFKTDGTYRLVYGGATSAPFGINKVRTAELATPLLNFFYADRCGHAVEGVHGVCHTELFCEHAGVRKPVNGGWHDAGNFCQGTYRTALATSALFDAHQRLGASLSQGQRVALLEEACWGLDWLLGTRFGNGVRASENGYTVYQDGVADSGDEIVGAASNPSFEGFLFVSTAVQASRALAKADPSRAAKARSAAIEDYAAAIKALPVPLESLPEAANSPSPHEVLSHAILAALALWDIAAEARYRDDAVAFGARLMALQEQRIGPSGITGYYNRDPRGERRVLHIHTSFADAPSLALGGLCRAFPEHADRSGWYAAVAIESEFFLYRGAMPTAPFGHVPTAVWKQSDVDPYVQRALSQIPFAEAFGAPEIVPSSNEKGIRADLQAELDAAVALEPGTWLRTFPIAEDRVFHGAGTIQLTRALALSEAAGLRNRPELKQLARRQLDWQLGMNPFCSSLVYGVGDRFASQMQVWADDFVGAVPVGMDSRRDQPFWPHTSHMTSREMWVVPAARMLALSAAFAEPSASASAGVSLTASEVSDGKIRITAKASGSTRRLLRLQGHNLAVSREEGEPKPLSGGQASWVVEAHDKRKAWVATVADVRGTVLADVVGPSATGGAFGAQAAAMSLGITA